MSASASTGLAARAYPLDGHSPPRRRPASAHRAPYRSNNPARTTPDRRPTIAAHSTLFGRIAYRASDGRETGRERFELISQDGGVVLRAFCEMDDVALTRDVTLAMDEKWRPLDGFCRLTRGGRREAAMWFDVGQSDVHLSQWIAPGRTETDTLTLPAPLTYLGLHPLQGDALIVNQRGVDRQGEFVPIDAITNSISPDGDDAPGLRRVTIDVAYIGEESVTVAAGRFTARRYALRWDPAWPAADLWVRQQDCVFLKMEWAFASARYELVELTETSDLH